MTWLTKSRFLSGLRCPKRLWLEIHEPLAEIVSLAGPILEGRKVDALVQRLAPGIVISRERGMAAAIAETNRLRAGGMPERVYQPAFQAGDIAAIADVVETRGANVTLTEVKSTTGVKPEHLSDVSFQALVMKRAGMPADRMQLMHLDSTFILQRAGDYDGLFHAADVTAEVEQALPAVEEAAVRCIEVMAQRCAPEIRTGEHCSTPWECPYLSLCVAQEGGRPEYSVEMLPYGSAVIMALKQEGYADLRAVPIDRLKSDIHRRVHRSTVSGERFLDRGAAEEVAGLAYPISYLDFETVAPAIPELVGTRPY